MAVLKFEEKVFYGSLSIAIDKRKILGTSDLSAIIAYNTLWKSYQFALAQFNADTNNSKKFYEKSEAIRLKMLTLQKCNDLCNYKQRLLFSETCVNP